MTKKLDKKIRNLAEEEFDIKLEVTEMIKVALLTVLKIYILGFLAGHAGLLVAFIVIKGGLL